MVEYKKKGRKEERLRDKGMKESWYRKEVEKDEKLERKRKKEGGGGMRDRQTDRQSKPKRQLSCSSPPALPHHRHIIMQGGCGAEDTCGSAKYSGGGGGGKGEGEP